MKNRTVVAFYTKARGRLEQFISRMQRLPLAYGETQKDRNDALKEMGERATRYSDKRRNDWLQRGRRKGGNGGGRGSSISAEIKTQSKAERRRELERCRLAIARAHQPPQLTRKAAKKLTKRHRVAVRRDREFLGLVASVPRA